MKLMIKYCAVLAVFFALSGCSVVPKPYDNLELQQRAADQANRATADQEPVTKPVTLHEAMARALKYNLIATVQKLEVVQKQRLLELKNSTQLPNLVAGLNYSGRNNYDGASSRSLITGQPSFEVSTSSDRNVVTSDLNLSWNVLDFGLSYLRAQQAADQALIARETRRMALHSLLQEVRATYWKAVAAERLSRGLATLKAKIKDVENSEQVMEHKGTAPPLLALTYQRELIELQIELQKLLRELVPAKTRLAALMNLPPSTDFKLSLSGGNAASFSGSLPVKQMITTALLHRPELRQAGYSERINEREAEAALLEILPSVAPLLSVNYDSNSFVYENDWLAASAKASWNLMKLFSYHSKNAAIQAAKDTLDKKSLAATTAIIMQTCIAKLNYTQKRKYFYLARNLSKVEKKILQKMSAAYRTGTLSEHALLRQKLKTLVADTKRNISYSEYQAAFGTLAKSLGLDAGIDGIDEALPVKLIAETLASNWRVISKNPTDISEFMTVSSISK
ncbi:MAG: TolC family protein [Alphaproteobacteria bacterium]